jgi:hypothetical protein
MFQRTEIWTVMWPFVLFMLLFVVKILASTSQLGHNSGLFNEFVCKLGLFWHKWASFHSHCKASRVPKKAQFTHERVEYNVFLFDEPPKGSKSLKIFKISLTFRFDKL